jgi:hypothetical protein
MGSFRSLIGPYFPKISRKWFSLTFLVNCSTTIWIIVRDAINKAAILVDETALQWRAPLWRGGIYAYLCAS